jgi:hypothetical protein
VTKLFDTLSHFPTVVPTTVLMFCLAWFGVSLLVSGLDGNPNTHGPRLRSGGKGHGKHPSGKHHGGHRHARKSHARARIENVPLSLSATIVSFGAWAVCLLASFGLDALHLHNTVKIVAGATVLAVGVGVGLAMLTAFAIPAEKVLVMHAAPGRADAVGAMCRVRTLRNGVGDAKVTTGRNAGSIIPFEIVPGDVVSVGDEALIVSYDPGDERYVVGHLDQLLRES